MQCGSPVLVAAFDTGATRRTVTPARGDGLAAPLPVRAPGPLPGFTLPDIPGRADLGEPTFSSWTARSRGGRCAAPSAAMAARSAAAGYPSFAFST